MTKKIFPLFLLGVSSSAIYTFDGAETLAASVLQSWTHVSSNTNFAIAQDGVDITKNGVSSTTTILRTSTSELAGEMTLNIGQVTVDPSRTNLLRVEFDFFAYNGNSIADDNVGLLSFTLSDGSITSTQWFAPETDDALAAASATNGVTLEGQLHNGNDLVRYDIIEKTAYFDLEALGFTSSSNLVFTINGGDATGAPTTSSNSTYGFSSFNISQVPEPSVLTLAGLGSLLILGRRTRS